MSKRAYKTAWLILLVLPAWVCLSMPAYAAADAVSAEWSLQDARAGRERVLLHLNGADAGEPDSIVRNGPQSVEMIWPALLGKLPGGLMVSPPPEALLFNGIVPGERGLILLLKDPAFGFVVTRPKAGLIQIDIFKNPLGARWEPPADSGQAAQPAQSGQPVQTAQPGQSGQSSQSAPPDPAQAQSQSPIQNQTAAPAATPAATNPDTPGSGSAAPVSVQTQAPAKVQTQASDPPAAPVPPGQFLAPPAAAPNANPAQVESLTPIDFPPLPAEVLNPVMAAQPKIADQVNAAVRTPDAQNSAATAPPSGAQNNAPGNTQNDAAAFTQGTAQSNVPGNAQSGLQTSAPNNAAVPPANQPAERPADLQSGSQTEAQHPTSQTVARPDTLPGTLPDARPDVTSNVQTGALGEAATGPAPQAMPQDDAGALPDNPPLYPLLAPEHPATRDGAATDGSTDASGAAPGVFSDLAPGTASGVAPDAAIQGEAEEEEEQYLEWPPMVMPETLPPAPLPPLFDSGQGSPASPPDGPTSLSPSGGPSSDSTFFRHFLRFFKADTAYAAETATVQAETAPVAGQTDAAAIRNAAATAAADQTEAAPVDDQTAAPAAAATSAGQAEAGAPIQYETIDAPFIYRGRLVKDGPKPDPAESRIPVLVNVPAATVTEAERGVMRTDGQGDARTTDDQTDLTAAGGQTGGQTAEAQPVSATSEAASSQPDLATQQPATTPAQPGGQSGLPTQQPTITPAQPGGQSSPHAQQPALTTVQPAQPAQVSPPTVQPDGVDSSAQPQSPTDAASPPAAPVGASEQSTEQPLVQPAGHSASQPSDQPGGQSAGQTADQARTAPDAASTPSLPTDGAAPPATQPAGQAAGSGTAPADEGKPVIYVDEQGNPVDPPLEPQQAIVDLERHMSSGSFPEAYEIADTLSRQNNLDRQQREYVLHRRADAMFSMHRDKPADFFNEIMDTTTTAINFNTRSPRNSEAYLRLGFLQLKVNNAYEAEAYFSVLRQQYPKDEAVPLSYYYMGDYQYTQGNLNDAVLQFVHVVQEHPDSRYSRDAALGLTRTLYRLGYYDKAYEVIDYVEKRWPRYYLDYPPVLGVLGDTSYRARQIDRARQSYLLYYNLMPDAPDANITLSRIGDIYLSQKYRNAATFVYEEAVRRFPGTEGGVIAMMRLAENGINDDPTMAGMFKVFQQPFNLGPAEAYRKILRDYPDSPLVPLVKLKLAMWSIWQKDFEAAFQLCNEIVMADPNHPLAIRAIDVSRNAFAMLAAESVNSRRYERVLDAWNRYPLLHTQEEFLDPDSRMALAVSQWEGDDPDSALRTIEPFFLGTKLPEYSEMALTLGLTILVEYDRWQAVEDLADRVALWEITPATKRQMDYALGLAYENQGKSREATPIWRELYEQEALPPEQQAYADYFLARHAESDNDLENAYRIGQDALQHLKDLAVLNPEQADTEKIKTLLGSLMNIAQTSGLLQNALDYGKEYLTYASPGSDDYLSVMYNMAALQRKRGSMGEWEKILTSLSADYPDTYYGKAASSQLSAYRMDRDASQYAPEGGF